MKKNKNNYLDDYIKSQEYNFDFDNQLKGNLPLDVKYAKKNKSTAWALIINGIVFLVLIISMTCYFLIDAINVMAGEVILLIFTDIVFILFSSILIRSGIRKLKQLKKLEKKVVRHRKN